MECTIRGTTRARVESSVTSDLRPFVPPLKLCSKLLTFLLCALKSHFWMALNDKKLMQTNAQQLSAILSTIVTGSQCQRKCHSTSLQWNSASPDQSWHRHCLFDHKLYWGMEECRSQIRVDRLLFTRLKAINLASTKLNPTTHWKLQVTQC